MKDFKVAHIVPVKHLSETSANQYHMCLAHLVGNKEYRNHYIKMAKKGRFVLMDNGAAEGQQLNYAKLMESYKIIHPTEIVLPDTLYESGSTIQKSRNFLQFMQDTDNLDKYRIMAVPQGKTLDEWEACARIFIKDTRINSIGVSKFLNVATKNKYVRMMACYTLERLFKEYNRTDIEVHLLGCDEGPLIVNMIKTNFKFVRGCDSAFAYLQAQANKTLTICDDSRPVGTIDFIGGEYLPDLAKYINNFNEFAGASDNGLSSNW